MQRIAIAALVAVCCRVVWSGEVKYQPKSKATLTEIGAPVVELLRDLPGVAEVSVSPAKGKLDQRIIHLRDWHFLPRDLFAADLRANTKRKISDPEIDDLYEHHLSEVELVQQEQIALLRCLLRHHGLRVVYVEGLTDEDALLFRIKLRVMRKTQRRLQDARRTLDETREQLAELAAKIGEEDPEYQELVAIKRKLESLFESHRMDLLRIGAPGRLFLSEELDSVLPADDLKAWEQADPLDDDGKVRLGGDRNERRENAAVKKLLAAKPCAVVLFGGLHNFADNIDRISGGNCEYIRVTTRRYRQFGGK